MPARKRAITGEITGRQKAELTKNIKELRGRIGRLKKLAETHEIKRRIEQKAERIKKELKKSREIAEKKS